MPHYESIGSRFFRQQAHFPAYCGRDRDSCCTPVTSMVFEKTRQRSTPLVLLLRGMAKGEPTTRLSCELCHHIQDSPCQPLPTESGRVPPSSPRNCINRYSVVGAHTAQWSD